MLSGIMHISSYDLDKQGSRGDPFLWKWQKTQ
jgi:hypothetical protein